MIDLIIIIMAGIVLLFLLSCCFMVARLLDEEISMYGYDGKGNNFPINCREVQQMKDMEINEKIRYFRKQRGLSQELLAERTGINVNTIRKYEIGIRKPKVEQLKKIADGLEISVIEFLNIEIENEADLIAMLKKISPFFKWDGLLHVLVGEKFL